METYIYRDIIQKKIDIYIQQKNIIIKNMILESQQGHGAIEDTLYDRNIIRQDRLTRIDIKELLQNPIAILPSSNIPLETINRPVEHLKNILEQVSKNQCDSKYQDYNNSNEYNEYNNSDGGSDSYSSERRSKKSNTLQTNDYMYYDDYEDRFYDPHMIARIAVSSLEEAMERQRLVGYARIYAEAESNYGRYKDDL